MKIFMRMDVKKERQKISFHFHILVYIMYEMRLKSINFIWEYTERTRESEPLRGDEDDEKYEFSTLKFRLPFLNTKTSSTTHKSEQKN
jgi:hypothetical protein